MSRVTALSASLRAELAAHPAARGLLLGLALLAFETALVPFETATVGVVLLVSNVLGGPLGPY